MLDEVYGEVVLVDAADGDWRSALAATIVNTIEALARHPGLGAVALGLDPDPARGAPPRRPRTRAHGPWWRPGVTAALAIDLISQFVAATAAERAIRRASGDGQDRDRIERSYRTTTPSASLM